MVGATLERNCRREEYEWSEAGQGVHERDCGFWRQMLGNFQRYSQVKDTLKRKRLRKVDRVKGVFGYLQEIRMDIFAVDAKYFIDAELLKNR